MRLNRGKQRYPCLKHIKELKRRREIARRRKHGSIYSLKNRNRLHKGIVVKDKIVAPVDLRFIQNPSETLVFFNSLRNRNNISEYNKRRYIEISLYKVEKIDFATISILKSIFGEYSHLGVAIRGNYPKHVDCRKKMEESGFFKGMTDNRGGDILTLNPVGTYHKFEKAGGKLIDEHFEKIEKVSEEAYSHLYNSEGYFDELETILKEIAGNAVEWGRAYNREWQIGFFKSEGKVTITVTDLGKGIIDSLFISEKLKVIDFLFLRSKLDVLNRAFERKYGSFTQEPNRNRGLPMIKNFSDEKFLKNLYVCSNEAFIDFEKRSNSRLLNTNFERFNGTFYQWELSL